MFYTSRSKNDTTNVIEHNKLKPFETLLVVKSTSKQNGGEQLSVGVPQSEGARRTAKGTDQKIQPGLIGAKD